MDVAIALVVAAMVLIGGGTGTWIAWDRRKRNREPDPYELHRSRWETTGSLDELDAMLREIGKREK